MIALSVDSAKNIAIGAAGVFVVFSLLSAWVIKNVVTKIIMIVLMVGLALGVWTQRTSLQDCADKAQAAVKTGNTDAVGGDLQVLRHRSPEVGRSSRTTSRYTQGAPNRASSGSTSPWQKSAGWLVGASWRQPGSTTSSALAMRSAMRVMPS